jgi:hypothetical protein
MRVDRSADTVKFVADQTPIGSFVDPLVWTAEDGIEIRPWEATFKK